MLLIGAHRINHGSFDAAVCRQIQKDSALIVGSGTAFGSGVYAYYPDRIPANFRMDSLVVFQAQHSPVTVEIADIWIQGVAHEVGNVRDMRFFVIRAPIDRPVPVAILGFKNCPGLPDYPGTLFFV